NSSTAIRACPPGVLNARTRPSLIQAFTVGVETWQCEAAWPVVSDARASECFGFFAFFTWNRPISPPGPFKVKCRAAAATSTRLGVRVELSTRRAVVCCGQAVVLLRFTALFVLGMPTRAQGRR